ncbi:hypothetical protein PtrSN002B_010760 [Pyrenophora tritici-repentis]|uniref:Gag-like protein n=1 Tax=Pyrenophora tritici-repentis (strain Pt-1C-BFP) TaxID=426418 RepID=B2WQ08_PYRTR|nr:uncharacterized protein PTRG_12076 [Pyrenophora tritici-repentis Pt-1C-BFP]KAI1524544.1 hypothetical protein PtrSN001C_010996 [Pyrenophora tritici-repentis]EDU46224.1 conserved hypothetical protein [Pyrenophora tritici-repentis Pt-1C-BFP]KAI1531408.1 hypothetical protein PtrSN002B_010760 [Pyrenophora tritici-repentis]KAI1562527.1 hypothetical protein PtrEW7m1_010910 [Pyrenophora tritici-repentis]KAI1577527.1 hypothetical protein PtrEW13061_010493 [Pyrenophora tritici-repentis]
MATPWPRRSTWPIPIDEHATNLSAFLREVLSLIERNRGQQPLPADIVGDIIRGALTFVLKTQHSPDLGGLSDALNVARTEARATAESTARTLDQIKQELKSTVGLVQQSATKIQQNGNMAEEARAAAKDATEVGKATLEIAREIRNKRPQEQANGPMSYAAAAARGVPLAGTYNAQSVKQPSAQTQREVIMNIRDPLTVQSLRAMNPSNLKMHVQRAIEQSGNENIVNVKIVSSNQLKSGDLSIKTASSREVEALQQFADDWAHRIGSGTTVQIPTFGVLAHGIRTSTMDMSKLDEIRAQILQDNRPFIPRAEIRHIGWLTRDATTKTATTITIEFTKPEDADKIIDEGLIWQGTQCKAATACGHCAQEHDTRDCPSRAGQAVTRKCAACRGEHEAWSRQCPTRKDEIAKARTAYEMRPRYHHVSQTAGQNVQIDIPTSTIQRRRTSQPVAATQPMQPTSNRSQTGRGQKRTNAGTTIDPLDQENPSTQANASQRPHRQIIPSRRALESTGLNTRAIQNNSSHHMEIDSDDDA